MTDRPLVVAGAGGGVDIRWLMYQPLICRVLLRLKRRRDHPRRHAAPFDPQDVERLAHPLVDGVRRYAQFEGNFLRRQMLIDQNKALPLPFAQAGHADVYRLRQNAVLNWQS